MSANQDQNPELELITLLKKGNEDAYFKVVNLYKGQVAKITIGMLGDVQEAEDVGQEVFIRFFKSIENFKGDAKISTYLTRIAINLSLNELERRKRKWRIFYQGDNIVEKMVSDTSACFSDGNEKSEMLRKAIDKLEPKYKEVVVLRALQDLSFKELTEVLQLPLGTVLSRYARAQKKLRELLNPVLNEH